MFKDAIITPLIGTMRSEASNAFYRDTLGLKLVSEDQFAAVFEGANARIRVSRAPGVAPAPYAILSFTVGDIEAAADALIAKGVTMARFPMFQQDARGIWAVPGGGAKVAWFHDPDFNLLSIVQEG